MASFEDNLTKAKAYLKKFEGGVKNRIGGEDLDALDGSSFETISPVDLGVLAKVARDREMQRLDAEYPGYGFAKHKGYGTPEHLVALRRLGPTAIHRRGFAPVMQMELPGLGNGEPGDLGACDSRVPLPAFRELA